MKTLRIAIGSDHGGFDLKGRLVAHLKRKGFVVRDMGTHSSDSADYPDTASAVARAVAKKTADRGILVCKTGIGNSIVANKFRGVRAALCYNLKSATLSRRHNDANILVLGALFVPADRAKRMIDVWLSTGFEGGRHQRRLDKLERIEESCPRA